MPSWSAAGDRRPGPAGGESRDRTRWIAVRAALVGLLLSAGLVAVATRAVKLQVLQGEQLARHGDDQWRRSVELLPRRGPITDRNGETLAASAEAPSIAASPAALRRLPRADLARLARALGVEQSLLERRAQRAARFAWLARRVSPAQARAVRELGLEGVDVFPEARRYYTSQSLAAQLVGFVGDDGQGLEGIERAHDEALQGGAVRLPSFRDARGRAVLDEAPGPQDQLAGARVELALDVGLQLAAESALARAVESARAASGMLVAMDPSTGEVLALAHAPTFNPNLPRRAGVLRNRSVLDTFEPGSTFKVFTLAGALDAGVLKPHDLIDAGEGALRIGRHTINDDHHDDRHRFMDAERLLTASSNVGAAKVGALLGRERLQRTLLAFGFGERTGTEIPGEPRGAVPFPSAEVALATMSFGQGVAASPLQITAAFAAIANGGMLMKPILVRRVVDAATGAPLTVNDPTPVRRAVSRETAALLRGWMRSVVESPDGTGKKARIPGWAVGGKTGTAQKADPVTRRYSADRRFSSFVGFAPVDAPRIAVGVFIDEPRGDRYGGQVAAPAFREVVEHALKSMGVTPTEDPVAAAAALAGPQRPGEAPLAKRNVPGRSLTAAPYPALAAATLRAAATGPGASGEGQAEAETPPALDEDVPAPALDEDGGPAPAVEAGAVVVPALAGLPARAALRDLEARALSAELQGSGRVTSQDPPPGRAVPRGARVRLLLAPPRPTQ